MSDSRHIVDEIKSKIRLSELIGEHVRLRRDGSGVRAMGLCPFHNEKSPSFSVNDDRGFYYCFGCGAKGDALTFLQDHVGLSFREALQQLADRTGVELPQQRGPEDRAAQQRARSAREAYQEVMGFARDLYVQTLWETQAGAPGRAYLEERGIDRETAERFQLGMAPDSWDTLVREARARRIPSSWLERAGLAKARQGRAGGDEQDAGSSRADGGHYDLFRNRVMFPILDVSGRVLAFSGRSLDPNDRAKYINSPETRFYVKGEQLYGLHAARAGIRQGGSAVLVEGNFDVVALHARGITRAVAPLGTALTPQQVQLLKRFAERVVLAFDADRAGRAAARRAFEVLLDERLLDVRYVRLPDGQDPDDVVRDGGAAAFEELEASARQMLDVCIDDALAPTMQDRSPIVVRGALVAMGDKTIDRANWNWDFVGSADNPFFTPDPASVPVFSDYLDAVRKEGSSVGALVEIVAEGVPAGLGAPVYGKLDQDIASNLMSINAVKGVEIGDGFETARMRGEDNADEMRMGNDGRPLFLSNHAGGILGGISTGQPVVARFAVKPTSSILTPRRSIDVDGNEVEVRTKGRHDPCVGIRAVPVGEAMVACAIADHYLRHRGQTGKGSE